MPLRGNRASGGCLYNSDVLQHPPSCDGAHPETQRLCACRTPLMAATAEKAPEKAKMVVPKVTKTEVQQVSMTAEAAGWKPGVRAEAWRKDIAAFAPKERSGTAQPPPPLLLLAGDRPEAARETVQALLALRGFQMDRLLVSLGCCGAEVERTKRTLEVNFPKVTVHEEETPLGGSLRGRSRLLADSARDTEHLRMALTRSLNAFNSSSLLVVHEGTLFSPDFLQFFSQLELVMEEDATVWCVGAWNDAGLAPYVADRTALLRTDWHPAKYAWMMRRQTLQELLSQWPGAEWERFLRMDQIRLDRHCIIPEVSRCYPFGPSNLDDPALRRSERAAFDEFHRTIVWNQDASVVQLGDVRRLLEGSYEKLLLHDWPGDEALVKSNRTTFRQLLKVTEGNWHLVLEDRQWSKAASFLRLPSTKEIHLPASYRGYLRLRWRNAVLHLLLSNSPLLASAEIPTAAPKKVQDFQVAAPVLRAPVVSVVVGHLGQSCDVTCAREVGAFRCHDADLLFLNGCSSMRQILGPDACGECLASDGQDYPAVVLVDAQLSAEVPEFELNFKGKFNFEEHSPSLGSCLFAANLAQPPRCHASHQRLARLCPCRATPNVAKSGGPPAHPPSDRAIYSYLLSGCPEAWWMSPCRRSAAEPASGIAWPRTALLQASFVAQEPCGVATAPSTAKALTMSVEGGPRPLPSVAQGGPCG
ncbi:unnamed protein product [Durusdinium trenchii]